MWIAVQISSPFPQCDRFDLMSLIVNFSCHGAFGASLRLPKEKKCEARVLGRAGPPDDCLWLRKIRSVEKVLATLIEGKCDQTHNQQPQGTSPIELVGMKGVNQIPETNSRTLGANPQTCFR